VVLVLEVERMADRLSTDVDDNGRITNTDAASFIQRFASGDAALVLKSSGWIDQSDLSFLMPRFEANHDDSRPGNRASHRWQGLAGGIMSTPCKLRLAGRSARRRGICLFEVVTLGEFTAATRKRGGFV